MRERGRPGGLRRILIATGLLLPAACSPPMMAIDAVAVTGNAFRQERGLAGTADDLRIRVEINDAWLREDLAMFRLVNLAVYEGRVLLTGWVRYAATREEAVRLARDVDGVREVIDEIKVQEAPQHTGNARDNLIVSQLRTALLLDTTVRSSNYLLDCVDGTVYLLGVARNRIELDRVFAHIQTLPYVRAVVSHVQLRDDPARIQS